MVIIYPVIELNDLVYAHRYGWLDALTRVTEGVMLRPEAARGPIFRSGATIKRYLRARYGLPQEPLERERILQFMKGLEDAEAKLAKLGPNVRQQARTGRLTLVDMVNQQEVENLKGTVINLRHTYEKIIKRTVRDPTTLNMIGERLLRLMKELGVPP